LFNTIITIHITTCDCFDDCLFVQVVSIVCYPLYGKAIATLKEDAVINGEEFIRPGLSVDLGDGFSYKQEISQQIREVEKKLGFEGQTEISIKTYELSRKSLSQSFHFKNIN